MEFYCAFNISTLFIFTMSQSVILPESRFDLQFMLRPFHPAFYSPALLIVASEKLDRVSRDEIRNHYYS